MNHENINIQNLLKKLRDSETQSSDKHIIANYFTNPQDCVDIEYEFRKITYKSMKEMRFYEEIHQVKSEI
jgi:hypothetical protein